MCSRQHTHKHTHINNAAFYSHNIFTVDITRLVCTVLICHKLLCPNGNSVQDLLFTLSTLTPNPDPPVLPSIVTLSYYQDLFMAAEITETSGSLTALKWGLHRQPRPSLLRKHCSVIFFRGKGFILSGTKGLQREPSGYCIWNSQFCTTDKHHVSTTQMDSFNDVVLLLFPQDY